MRAGIMRWLRQATFWAAVCASVSAGGWLASPQAAQGTSGRQPPAQQIRTVDPGGIGGIGG